MKLCRCKISHTVMDIIPGLVDNEGTTITYCRHCYEELTQYQMIQLKKNHTLEQPDCPNCKIYEEGLESIKKALDNLSIFE